MAVTAGAGQGPIAREGASPIALDDIPACFLSAEPQPAPDGEKTEVFPVPSFAPRPPAAPTPPTVRIPDVHRIAGESTFPLYVFDAPRFEFQVAQLRESTVPVVAGRQVSLFVIQYRLPATRGGGLAIVLSGPSRGATPPREDLDDAIDAVRLFGRLQATPVAVDPLAEPGVALRRLGCPAHDVVDVVLDGRSRRGDFVTWPGAPGVYLLRVEAENTEVTVETGKLSRVAALALSARLVSLQSAPQVLAGLQAVFNATPAPPRTAAPIPQSTGAPVRPRLTPPTGP